MKNILLCFLAVYIAFAAGAQDWVRINSTAEKLVCVKKIKGVLTESDLKSCTFPSMADIDTGEGISNSREELSKKISVISKQNNDYILLIYNYSITEVKRLKDQTLRRKIYVYRMEKHFKDKVVMNVVLLGGLIKENGEKVTLELNNGDVPEPYDLRLKNDANIDRKINASKPETILQSSPSRVFTQNFFEWKGNPWFFFSATYQIGFSYRMLLVRNPAFTGHDLLDQRQRNEKPVFQHYPSLTFGIKLGKKRADYFTFKASWWKQGFEVENGRVSWETGFFESRTGNSSYSFTSFGLGPGYAYTKFRDKWSARFATGVMFLMLQEYKDPNQVSLNDPSIWSINTFSAAVYAELGCNLRLSRFFSTNVSLHGNQNFTRLHTKDLATYPNNLSLVAGLTYHFGY